MHTFWSLVVEPGKIYKNVVESGVQITRAALDTSAATEQDEGLCQITLTHEGKKMTIGNLSIKHGCFQTQLDLIFQCGEEIAFSTNGAKLPVTLTGVSGVDDDDSDDDDYMVGDSTLDELDDTVDESLDEIEPPQLVGKKRKIKPMTESAAKAMKLAAGGRKGKEMSLAALNDDTLLSEDSDDDTYNPTLNDSSMLGEDDDEEDSDLEEEMEDEEDSDDLGEEEGSDEEVEEEEEDSEEEMEESPVKPQPKKSMMNGNHQEKSKKLKVQTPEQKSTPKQSKVEKLKARENKAATTPTVKGAKDTPSKKDGKTPKGEKKSKLENKENLEAKATPKQDKKNKDGKTPKGEKKTPSKQNRTGGVIVEDLSVGNGQAAKSNSMVSVYYEGRLKSGKTFDKTVSGPPFKFKLGKGEVIKGWDVGLVGMQVGGKRRISIPPNMGYGSQGAGRDIPPNSHLVFDVTLINTK